MHDLGRSTNDFSPYQWFDTSDEDYYTKMNLDKGDKREAAYASKHAAMCRLQFWAEAVDSMLRERDGEKFNVVPKPKVKLMKNEVANAYVSQISVCLDLSISFAGAPEKGGSEALGFSRRDGVFFDAKNEVKRCVRSPLPLEEQIALVKWQLSPNGQCTFKVQDKALVLDESCLGKNHALGKIRSGKKFVVKAISNQLTFTSKLLETLSEDQAISVLAHELGHYYMAHGVAPAGTYGMFYKLGESNPEKKPQADAESEALGKQLTDITEHNLFKYVAFKNQKYHSVLFAPVSLLAGPFSSKDAPICQAFSAACEPCVALHQFFADAYRDKGLGGFPYKAVTLEQEKLYFKYEQLTTACASKIKLSEQGMIDGALPQSEIISMVASSNKIFSNRMQPLPAKSNANDLLLAITAKAQTMDQAFKEKIQVFLQDAIKFNLSRYTVEQEADELSAEWVHALGIDPRAAIASAIKMGKLKPEGAPRLPGEVSAVECEKLYKNKWRDAKGNYAMIAVADWQDEHHSYCFRAFNIDREISVHKLLESESQRKTEKPAPTWPEILKSLSQKTASK